MPRQKQVAKQDARISDECKTLIVERLGTIEIADCWPRSTTTTFILSSKKSVTSERSMALLHTWIGWLG